MSFRIREAVEADLADLVTLNGIILKHHADLYPETFRSAVNPQEASDFLKSHMGVGGHKILVAQEGCECIAYLWYELQYDQNPLFKLPSRRLYVNHIFVLPRCQRMGVAARLLDYVQEAGAAQGVTEVHLDTWAKNSEAQAFFKSQGFDTYRMYLRKNIDQN